MRRYGSDIADPVIDATCEECLCRSVRVVEVKFMGRKGPSNRELWWCVGGGNNVVELCFKDMHVWADPLGFREVGLGHKVSEAVACTMFSAV